MNGRIKRAEDHKVGFPRIGQIKVGKKSEKGYPMSVDYFIATGKYAKLFTDAYGEKPQTIQIVFPSDEAEQVCNEKYEYRNDAGRLIAEGDGENFRVWNGQSYQLLSTNDYPNLMPGIAKKYPNKKTKNGDGWDITLTLNFIVPMVKGVAGMWQFISKGTNSTIPQIRETFDAMKAERGFVKGIIFDLSVKFATTQKPNDTSRFPVVSLVANESEDNVKKIKEALKPIDVKKIENA